MNEVTTKLLEHCNRARDVEGKVIRVPLDAGDLCILYQRPRRNGKVEDGYIDSICYRYEYRVEGEFGFVENLSPFEAEWMLAGATIDYVRERRQIKAAVMFEQIKRNTHIRPEGWF